MDISSLLSPQDSPVRSTPPQPAANPPNNAPSSPLRRPRPTSGKRTTSGLSNEVKVHDPPQEQPPRSLPSLPYDTIYQAQQTQWNPAYLNGAQDIRTPQSFAGTPASDVRSPYGTPQAQRPSVSYGQGRTMSNPYMDGASGKRIRNTRCVYSLLSFTSDMVSPQLPHQQPQQAVSRGNSYSNESARHASLSAPAVRMTASRAVSAVSSSEIVMAEAPSQTPPPRVVEVPSMSDADQKTVHELEHYLTQNSYDYKANEQLIDLLHRGFVAHVYGPDGSILRDPMEYGLLSDLRQAREAMDSRFAIGEDIWQAWIQDESLVAKTGEQRFELMELCSKAVAEEPCSVTLWLLYGEYVMENFSVAYGQAEGDPNRWTEIDKEICKEIFSHDVVLGVWQRAVDATRWRIDESSRIWDRYIDWIMAEFPEQPTPSQIQHVSNIFMDRLSIPHATWSETSQKFWPIVSKYNADNWEEIMATINEEAGPAKQYYALREEHELSVHRAAQSGDKTALGLAFDEYLKWEVKNERKGRGRNATFNFEVRSSLFERALLAFPTTAEWWMDYADYLITAGPAGATVLPVLERATRHCPWSGDLWSRRILRSEVEGLGYDNVEPVKHLATNSGLLSIGGLEEVLKVYAAWCSYLRRRAFDPSNSDDAVEMAEMGIIGTLEDAAVAGKKIYGDEFKGDPHYRLEKIHIKFLTEARRIDDARSVWERVSKSHSHSSDFWNAFYWWELLVWSHARLNDSVRVETPENAPHQASDVIRRAMSQRNLDWPEKIISTYAEHFQLHESSEAAHKAEIEARNASKYTAIRRAKEAEEAAAQSAAAQPVPTALETIPEEESSHKRKRYEEAEQNGNDAVKRNKTDDAKPAFEASSSISAQIKRDREHNTITIKDLPKDIDEKRIRQFLMDCGEILSVNISSEDKDTTAHATVEFGDHEGVLAAKTRDGKEISAGNAIRIQSGTLSTLYVTNYPADYDEVKLRELFQGFGTIVSVRFPSLKYNQKRRFCYVSFLTADEARAATSMNDKALDAQHRLTALISDPGAKKDRTGATAEGREVHISNCDFRTTEEEIRDHFGKSGTVQSIRMLRNRKGEFTGSGFVIFSKAEEAQVALELNNKPLGSRVLRVDLATDKSSAATHSTTSKIIRHTSAEAEDGASNRRGSIASNASAKGTLNDDTARTKHERTVALLNLPDTVNDARIQTFMSQHGPLYKIVMKPSKHGALVEFVNLQDAGKVGLGIDCSALGPDVRVGEASEMLGGRNKAAPAFVPQGAAMKPVQAGLARPKQSGGRRGGLGFKRGGAAFGGARGLVEGVKEKEGGEEVSKEKKGNADFRALFEKSREDGAAAAAE